MLNRTHPLARPSYGKDTKTVAIASGDGLPLAVAVENPSPAECKFVEAVLAEYFLDECPPSSPHGSNSCVPPNGSERNSNIVPYLCLRSQSSHCAYPRNAND